MNGAERADLAALPRDRTEGSARRSHVEHSPAAQAPQPSTAGLDLVELTGVGGLPDHLRFGWNPRIADEIRRRVLNGGVR
ncbi:MAG: hypothetical protein DMD46_02660 [Gemmatimonadetes bacterium]|nr:MAG: hypothetical protein DMD46_02660 [Gemmatimonadota bacterium]